MINTDELKRLTDWENGFVKYAIGSDDLNTIATLVYSTDFNDEMEIRFSVEIKNRFTVRGHKSIMDYWNFEQFKATVIMHIEREQRFLTCTICGYAHKPRPKSFCIALRDHKINDKKTKHKVVADIIFYSQANVKNIKQS